MKYLFINSVAGCGSTGRIAADKCRELMEQGHQCLLAYGREKANCDDVPTLRIGTPFDYKLHGVRCRLLDDHGFGSKRATKLFLEKVREYDPDVIWLHNIHGYYIHIGLLFEYLKSSGKKIIWTLHDCWSFTGHCAHFDYAGCDKWKTGCKKCPEKHSYPASYLRDNSTWNYLEKKNLFTGIPNLMLITPSKWLADLVKQGFLREYPVVVNHNKIDTDVFQFRAGNFREKYGLEDKKIVLGVSNVWNERKGYQDFLKMAQALDDSYQVVMVGLSHKQLKTLPTNILGIARTNNAVELAEIYSAADWFVNTTYEDTFPTVNLEARACGTRIVSYDTGGCRETIDVQDVLVPKGDIGGLLEAIKVWNGLS